MRAAAAAAVLLAAGCVADLGSSLGGGLVRGARGELEKPETRQAVRGIADTALAGVEETLREELAPTVDSTVRSVLREGEAAAGRLGDSVSVAVRGDLTPSMEELVRRTVERAGVESREELELTTARLRRDLEERLVPVLAPAVRDATTELVAELSRGVENELSVAAESAVSRMVRAGVQAGTGTVEESPLWQTVVRIALGAGAVAVLWIGAWLWRGHRRRDAALKAVAQAVKERGDDELRRHIKHRTTQRQVEGWFRDYLQSTGFLVTSDRHDGDPASGEGATDG